MGSEAKLWISAIASCARRFGRNPYEHGLKSASKMGSSTSFKLAWTTRSAMVGTDGSYCPPATACRDVSGSVLICTGQARVGGAGDVSMAGGTDILGCLSAAGGAWCGGRQG